MSISHQLRQLVKARAANCCEYCRQREDRNTLPFHIDHIIPLKHGGTDDADNLCLACYLCNGCKGSNVAALDPDTGEPTRLYNPRNHVWADHFQLMANYDIVGLTAEGRTTVAVLRMNDEGRMQQRQVLAELGVYPCN